MLHISDNVFFSATWWGRPSDYVLFTDEETEAELAAQSHRFDHEKDECLNQAYLNCLGVEKKEQQLVGVGGAGIYRSFAPLSHVLSPCCLPGEVC